MDVDFSWTDRAACKGMPPAIFFPDDKAGAVSPRVQQVCSTCPVADPCDEHAMKHEPAGFWNGTSANVRKQRRKAEGIVLVRIHTLLDDVDGPTLPDDGWGEAG